MAAPMIDRGTDPAAVEVANVRLATVVTHATAVPQDSAVQGRTTPSACGDHAPPVPFPPVEVDGDDDDRPLWDSLREASESGSARRIAAAEDMVFRHHLAWARSLAVAESADDPRAGPEAGHREAAELGLAQAILAWSATNSGRFVDFARRFIVHRVRRLPTGVSEQRLYASTTLRHCQGPADDADINVRTATVAELLGEVGMAWLDLTGRIIRINDAWQALGQSDGATPADGAGVGISYLAVCDAAQSDSNAERVACAIRRSADGRCAAPVTVRMHCPAPNRPRWFDVLITRRTDEHSRLMGVAVALSSVSPTIWEIPTQRAKGG